MTARDTGAGPLSFDNWRRSIGPGARPTRVIEFPLYSDARITGHIADGFGPYAWLNMVTADDRRPSVTLRLALFEVEESPDLELRTDDRLYHGGGLADELAALASLALCARVKAGGASREFVDGGDALGRPVGWAYVPEPQIPERAWIVVPIARGEKSLSGLARLKVFPSMSSEAAIAFVRSARLFQDALWIADAEPALAWLMLASAIEAVATHWDQTKGPAIERFRSWGRSGAVEEMVNAHGCPELFGELAEIFADLVGSTRKFTDFLLKFCDSPPPERPDVGRLEWSPSKMKKVYAKVYDYRSKALHEGLPFPAPMCLPPMRFDTGGPVPETPSGLGSSTMGGRWDHKDTPILLNTFVWITHTSIMNWVTTAGEAAAQS